jgi:hypothetical protein
MTQQWPKSLANPNIASLPARTNAGIAGQLVITGSKVLEAKLLQQFEQGMPFECIASLTCNISA